MNVMRELRRHDDEREHGENKEDWPHEFGRAHGEGSLLLRLVRVDPVGAIRLDYQNVAK